MPDVIKYVSQGNLNEFAQEMNQKQKTIFASKDTQLNFATPQMYGAVGDGTSDDSQAFLDMFADTDYSSFFIPEGEYKILANITITRTDISIIGAGMFVASLDFDDTYSFTFNSERVTVSDIKFHNAVTVTCNENHVSFNHCWFYHNTIGLRLNTS